MKKTATLCAVLLLAFMSYGQINIKGKLLNYNTNHPVKGATVNLLPDTANNFYTNKKGWFKIFDTEKGYDTLLITCEGYYDQIHVVNKVGKGMPQQIFLYPEEIKLDTLCYYRYDDNVFVEGKVFDKQKSKKAPGISIMVDNKKLSYSKITGDYLAIIPGNTDSITFQSDEFKTKSVYVGNFKNKEYLEVSLERKIPISWDTAWRKYKNKIGININPAINGAFSMYYLRLINHKHAVGISGTLVLKGQQIKFNVSSSEYTGYKISALYRYYVINNNRKGMFFQGKFIISSFEFDPLEYYYKNDNSYSKGVKTTVSPIGGGAGIGYYTYLPRSNRFCFNFYIGIRYLPLDATSSYTENQTTYYLNKTWWDVYGAGSVVDLKISFNFSL